MERTLQNMYARTLKQMPSNLSSARDYITYFITNGISYVIFYQSFVVVVVYSFSFIVIVVMRSYPNNLQMSGFFMCVPANGFDVSKRKRAVLPGLRWFNQFECAMPFFRLFTAHIAPKNTHTTSNIQYSMVNCLVITIKNHVQIFKLPHQVCDLHTAHISHT